MLNVFPFYGGSDEFITDRPREDFYAYNAKIGAFVVADGVSLWQGVEYEGEYPEESGAGLLARSFCDSSVEFFENNPKGKISEGFAFANKKAGERMNQRRSRYTVLSEHKNLFAATAAMVKITDTTLEWGHICDSGITVLSASGEVKFEKRYKPYQYPRPVDFGSYGIDYMTLVYRTYLRNAIDKNGNTIGYGVITGEERAERYFETGTHMLAPRDVVLIYTDGFASFVGLDEFKKIAGSDPANLDAFMNDFTAKHLVKAKQKMGGWKFDGSRSNKELFQEGARLFGKEFDDLKQWADERTMIAIQYT